MFLAKESENNMKKITKTTYPSELRAAALAVWRRECEMKKMCGPDGKKRALVSNQSIAEEIGMDETAFRRLVSICEKGSPEEVKRVLEAKPGDSISTVYKQMVARRKEGAIAVPKDELSDDDDRMELRIGDLEEQVKELQVEIREIAEKVQNFMGQREKAG